MGYRQSQTRWVAQITGALSDPAEFILPTDSPGIVVQNVTGMFAATASGTNRRLKVQVRHDTTIVNELVSSDVVAVNTTRYMTAVSANTPAAITSIYWFWRDFVLLPGVVASFRIVDHNSQDGADTVDMIAHGFYI